MRNTSWPRPCHIARVDRVQVDAKPPYNPRMPIHTGSGLLWSSSAVLPQQINCLSRMQEGTTSPHGWTDPAISPLVYFVPRKRTS